MALILDRALAAFTFGMTFFGMAVITIAQGIFDPAAITIERFIGGGILIIVAILMVRWSRQMTAEIRATLTATQEALESERKAREAVVTERDQLRRELMEEREWRISLERSGLTERRHRHLDEELPGDSDPPT